MHDLCDFYFATTMFYSEEIDISLYKDERIFSCFRYLSKLDKHFIFDKNKIYQGYLGVNIPRIKLLVIQKELRKIGLIHHPNKYQAKLADQRTFYLNPSISPVRYRDSENISKEEAIVIATNYANKNKTALGDILPVDCPVYFSLGMTYFKNGEAMTGGAIHIDKIDGHVWNEEELESYNYDYNNII